MAENLPLRGRVLPLPGASQKPPKPPAHLSAEAKGMWRSVVSGWVMAADALPLLRAALECWDQYQTARKVLADEGLTVVSPSGMVRRHPAADVARDALTSFRLSWRQLGLDPPKE